MKISYNPNDLNSLTIAAIKYSKDRSAELSVTDKTVKQTPQAFMESNYPKEKIPLVVHVLSTPKDDRYKYLKAYILIKMSELNTTSIFQWMRFFQNDLAFIGDRITVGGYYSEALDWAIAHVPVSKPVMVVKPKPVSKPKPAVKKEVKITLKKDNPLLLKSVKELRELGKKKKLKGAHNMTKRELIKML